MNRPRGLWLWTAAAVVAILVGVVWLWPTPEPSSPPEREAAPDSTGELVPDLLVGPSSGGHSGEQRWTKQPWRPVAVGFARDFAKPGRSMADWRARVGRWVTDYLAKQYRHTAKYRIPVARLETLTGPDEVGQAVTAIATYDTGLTLILRLEVFPGTGWQVTRVTPASQ